MTACCSFGGRAPVAATPRLANNGARLPCCVAAVCTTAETASRSGGVRAFAAGAVAAGAFEAISASALGASVTVSGNEPAVALEFGPTTASLIPLSVCDTASCNACPACSGTSESTSIERFDIAIRTRLSESSFSTWGVDHRSRLQHQIGRRALGGNHGKDRIDGDRHFEVSLD